MSVWDFSGYALIGILFLCSTDVACTMRCSVSRFFAYMVGVDDYFCTFTSSLGRALDGAGP